MDTTKMKYEPHEKDDIIIKCRKNKLSLKTISARSGLGLSQVSNRIKILRDFGFIQGHAIGQGGGSAVAVLSRANEKNKLKQGKKFQYPKAFLESIGKKTLVDLGANECHFIFADGLYCADKCCTMKDDKMSSYCTHHHTVIFSDKELKRL